MKASEFIKKFGLDSFKAAMICPQFKRYGYAILYSDEVDFSNDFIDKHADYMFKTSEIKRLVESHELVKSYGGLELAKKELQRQSILRWINPETEKLREAIADVEACKEVS